LLKPLLRLWSRPATRTLPIFGVLGAIGAVALTVEMVERRGPSPADAAPTEMSKGDPVAQREPVAAALHRDPLEARGAVADGGATRELSAKDEPRDVGQGDSAQGAAAAQILVPIEGSKTAEEPEQPRQQLAALPREDDIALPGPTSNLKRPPPLDLAAMAGTPADGSALKRFIDLYRKGDVKGGDAAVASVTDPSARTTLEWVAIRTNSKSLSFDRIAAFMKAHPRWPSSTWLRRRAEEALLRDRRPKTVVKAFFDKEKPVSAAGKVALARVLKAEGKDSEAGALIRSAWRDDTMGSEMEAAIIEDFKDALTRADHRNRMERLLFKEENGAALRAAAKAGADYTALAKARIAVANEAKNALSLLDGVPASVRSDTSYAYGRVLYLRRKNKLDDAVKLLAEVSPDPAVLVDGDEWWVERRIIARKLLDANEPQKAYDVVSRHGAETEAKKIEAEFHAGWIALRFLKDPAKAAEHFAKAKEFAETPISVARVAYWEGRAAEAAGNTATARQFYERAGKYPITYYGQLARTKLGLSEFALRRPPPGDLDMLEKYEAVRGIRLLYEAEATDLALPLIIDLGQRLEATHLDALGALVASYKDARTMVLLGKAATQKGQPLDAVGFPTMGIPQFTPAGEPVEKPMVYAIARQESIFDAKAVSHAGAKGLMQLMPATAKRTAKVVGLSFDVRRLTTDPAYNAKIGADHLRHLVDEWRGSYILTFAAYNAGSGNVKKWIDAYGDPRSAEVDPIDWVERIPFTETRNYVQRVMENLQVYRNRLGGEEALLIDGDMRRGAKKR
jgi:soluble lytic murein transglycosylase